MRSAAEWQNIDPAPFHFTPLRQESLLSLHFIFGAAWRRAQTNRMEAFFLYPLTPAPFTLHTLAKLAGLLCYLMGTTLARSAGVCQREYRPRNESRYTNGPNSVSQPN
jgi:hypothetical protein